MFKKFRIARQERFRQEKQNTVNYVTQKLRSEGLNAFANEPLRYTNLAYKMLYYTMLRDSTAARRMVKSGGRLPIPVVVSQVMVVAYDKEDWNSLSNANNSEFLRQQAIVQGRLKRVADYLKRQKVAA